MAAASAAGVDLGRDFLEKQAMRASGATNHRPHRGEGGIAEKWSGRLIPVLSAGFGGTLNYYFVRSWDAGRRKSRHRAVGSQRLLEGERYRLPDILYFIPRDESGHQRLLRSSADGYRRVRAAK